MIHYAPKEHFHKKKGMFQINGEGKHLKLNKLTTNLLQRKFFEVPDLLVCFFKVQERNEHYTIGIKEFKAFRYF